MRYEHIVLDLSTAACAAVLEELTQRKTRCTPWGYDYNAVTNAELANLANELAARLPRRDQDPQAAVPDNLSDLV